MLPPKASVFARFHAHVHHELQVLEQMAAMARDEATHPESRPENKYDTRALEASYLAAGQGQRLAELRELVAWTASEVGPHSRGRAGSLVRVGADDGERLVLLAPRGGPTVDVDGEQVALVSVQSPLGRALSQLAAGDVATVDRPGGKLEIEVLDLS